jgi:hypothetical protein
MTHLMREDECPQTSGGWLVPYLNWLRCMLAASSENSASGSVSRQLPVVVGSSLSAPNGSNAAQSLPAICALM